MLEDAKSERFRRIKEKSTKVPETDDELYEWIRDVLGFKIARYTTDPTHQSPFQFVADAFFERYPTLLAQGPRGGGKTLNYAILELACMVFKPGIWIVAVAGSEGQARDGYAYLSGNIEKDGVQGLIFREHFSHLVSEEPRVSKTVLNNGSRIEIRTGGSERAVSGPHPQILIIDELDHIDATPLSTAMGMAQSSDDYKAITLMASSQYHTVGTLQSIMNTAGTRNIQVYRFDLFDVMESCGRHYPYECGDCPLFEWRNPYTAQIEEMCQGRGARSDGHYGYRDAIKKYHDVGDQEAFALQYLLLTGGQQGMAYPQYGKRNQVKFSFDAHTEKDLETWTAFAGIDMRGRGRIVVLIEAPNMDAGGKRQRWAIAEWADDNNTPSKLIDACKQIKAEVLHEFGIPISAFWAERAAGDLIKDFPIELNAKTIPKEVGSVSYGVGRVRDGIYDNSDNTSLFVDPERCPQLNEALLTKYKCKKTADGQFDRDAFEKGGEDFADALRYAYVGGAKIPKHIPEHDYVDQEVRMRAMSEAVSRIDKRIAGGRWSPYG